MIKTFSENRKREFEPVTSDKYNRELEAADGEIEARDFVTDEEEKKYFIK